MDKLVSEISNLIRSFQEQMEAFLPDLELEVQQIIEQKNKNTNEIENYLDTLLSLCQHGVGDKLYIRLLEYYKTIDAEGARFYWEEYDKLEE
ncbi:MAG: hypothetical protein AAF806_29345 [Bacteroidota bacterium]